MPDYTNRRSLPARLRARRIAPMLQMMRKVHQQHGTVQILDVGGTFTYWNIIEPSALDTVNAHITIVNPVRLELPHNAERFSFLTGDGCNMKIFNDLHFDIVHSNSVIEHVGHWRRMVEFSAEVRRLAPCHFIQTPAFSFPLEPHCMTPFFHWLPLPWRISLVMSLHLGNWPKANSIYEAMCLIEGAQLLTKRMLACLFPDSVLITERFAGLPKSYIAIREPPNESCSTK